MPVYVDDLMWHGWRMRGKNIKSCHMFTDGPLEELHLVARILGLKRCWFQSSPPASLDHYDLTSTKREAAVSIGVIAVDRRNAVVIWRRIRARV